MIYKKDDELYEALDVIVNARFEGQCINKDYLGYWELFYDNILNISMTALRKGVDGFLSAIKQNPKSNELYSYHMRLFTSLMNTNVVILSAESLFEVFRHNLEYELDSPVQFDLLSETNGVLIEPKGFEKILLLMHIYQDTIDCKLRLLSDTNGLKVKK